MKIFSGFIQILHQSLLYLLSLRGVAQPGRASALGAECRQFESGYPDTKKAPSWGLFRILGSQISFTEGEARRASREVSVAKPKPAQPSGYPSMRKHRCSRIAARTLKPARAKRTQPVLSLDLSAAQASPKGKTRNEVSVLAIWLPLDA